jgi:hypothetical protein
VVLAITLARVIMPGAAFRRGVIVVCVMVGHVLPLRNIP